MLNGTELPPTSWENLTFLSYMSWTLPTRAQCRIRLNIRRASFFAVFSTAGQQGRAQPCLGRGEPPARCPALSAGLLKLGRIQAGRGRRGEWLRFPGGMTAMRLVGPFTSHHAPGRSGMQNSCWGGAMKIGSWVGGAATLSFTVMELDTGNARRTAIDLH